MTTAPVVSELFCRIRTDLGRSTIAGATLIPSRRGEPQEHGRAPGWARRATTRYLFAGAGEAAIFETNTSATILLSDVDGPADDLAHYAGPPATSSTVTYLYWHGEAESGRMTSAGFAAPY